MSIQLVAWALEQRTGSVSRKAVLIALANCTNHHTGLCCPSIKRVRHETELGESTVLRALTDLEAAGYIAREQRQRENGSYSTTVYTFPHSEGGFPQSGGRGSPTVTPLEPEVRTGSRSSLGEGIRTGRARNDIWDALETMFGPALTRTEQTARGKVVASLKAAGATPEEMFARAKRWPRHFDGATLTQHALEKHWSTLDPARKPLRRQ